MIIKRYTIKMNRAMEKAINILVKAQQECEDDYLQQTDPLVASKEEAGGQ